MGYFNNASIDTRTWEEAADDAARDRLDGAPSYRNQPQPIDLATSRQPTPAASTAAPAPATAPVALAHIPGLLEDYIAEIQTHLDEALKLRPIDDETKAEVAFWRAQRNAFTKALHNFQRGYRLTPTPSGYTVPSASRPGALVHYLSRLGEVWTCTCEAGEKGILHWHTALLQAYERAAEQLPPPPTPIRVKTRPAGLVLTHGAQRQVAASPDEVGPAIAQLATPSELGRRLAQAAQARAQAELDACFS